MKRIRTASAVSNQFVDGNPNIGQTATQFSAEWCNGLQESVAQVIEGAGLTLPTGDMADDYAQLLTAIQSLITAAVGDISTSPHVTQLGEGKWLHRKINDTAYYKFPNGQYLAYADYGALKAQLLADPASSILASDGVDKASNPGKWFLDDANSRIVMPDLRGEFLRIWHSDMVAGAVTRPDLGVHKAGQNAQHSHTLPIMGENTATNGTISGGSGTGYTAPSTNASGGDEAVPDHTAIYYVIRVK